MEDVVLMKKNSGRHLI